MWTIIGTNDFRDSLLAEDLLYDRYDGLAVALTIGNFPHEWVLRVIIGNNCVINIEQISGNCMPR